MESATLVLGVETIGDWCHNIVCMPVLFRVVDSPSGSALSITNNFICRLKAVCRSTQKPCEDSSGFHSAHNMQEWTRHALCEACLGVCKSSMLVQHFHLIERGLARFSSTQNPGVGVVEHISDAESRLGLVL